MDLQVPLKFIITSVSTQIEFVTSTNIFSVIAIGVAKEIDIEIFEMTTLNVLLLPDWCLSRVWSSSAVCTALIWSGKHHLASGEHHHREVASTTRCHLVPDWDSVDSDICYAVLPTGDVKKVTTYLVMLLSTKLMLLTVGQWPTCSLWIIIELRKLEIWAVVPKIVGVWSLKQKEVCLSAVPSKKYGLLKSFLEL